MRWLVWLVLAFVLAVGVALAARFNHGNVAILWPPYRIDVSVNLALLLLGALFALLHVLLLGLNSALRLPGRVREYRERRMAQRQAAALHDALLALFEGRFGRAERLARLAQVAEPAAGIAALIAARASHRMREFTRAEQWLQRADAQPGLRNAQLMTRAELATERREPAEALAAIDALHQGGARHIHALRLALSACEQAGRWREALRLAAQLEKRDALEASAARRLRIEAYRALFREQAGNHDALSRLWAEVPAAERIHPEIAAVACDAFSEAGDHEAARRLLESALDAGWWDRLGDRYAALPVDSARDRLDRLERLEGWRARYDDEPGLLRVLGELCLSERLWGKAQTLLERSLAHRPSAATRLALARLFEASDRAEQAAVHYRESALLAAQQAGRR